MAYIFLTAAGGATVLLLCYLISEQFREWIIDLFAGVSTEAEDWIHTLFPGCTGAFSVTSAGVGVWLLVGPAGGASPPPVGGPIVLAGRVVSRDTRSPLPDCRVAAGEVSARTDQDGSFTLTLSVRPAGEAAVRVTHEGHEPRSLRAGDLLADPGQTVELVPLPPAFQVDGSVNSQKTNSPLPNCTVSLGGVSARTGADGLFRLTLPARPGPAATLSVSHGDHVPKLFRFDDYQLGGGRAVELAPKLRLLVVEFPAGEAVSDQSRKAIRSRMSERFAGYRELGLLDDEKRDEVVDQLVRYQDGRALYDKETLAKVGNFHGATHGIFGSAKPGNPKGIDLECSLIDLKTHEATAKASTWVASEAQAAAGSEDLVDQLLAQLCAVTIHHPRKDDVVPRVTMLRGHVLYFPKSWTLWVSVLPHGSEKHFPQLRLTVQADGSWLASRVQIGPDKALVSPEEYEVYAVLVNPEGTRKILDYHDRIKSKREPNEGLALNAWESSQCRLLGSIQVARDDRAAAGR